MKEKIKKLIEADKILDPFKKTLYLKILELIPDDNLGDLFRILENEQKGVLALEQAKKAEETGFYEKSLSQFKAVYRNEYKKAVLEEKAENEKEADDLLNQIDL